MNTSKNNEQNEKEVNTYSLYMHINKTNQKKYIGVTKKTTTKKMGIKWYQL